MAAAKRYPAARADSNATLPDWAILVGRDRLIAGSGWALIVVRFQAFILSLEKSNDKILSHLDIGVMAQTICLVAMNYGLGTCIEDQGTFYPEVLRKYAGVPETSEVIISIAIGYHDGDFPANRLESTREPLEKLVTWCGFD